MKPALSVPELQSYAAQAGFQGDALNTIVAIALRESGGIPDNLNYNPTAGCNAPSSYDRGVLQINDTCWPQYSSADPNSCAYDPLCAFKAAFTISNGGTNFTPWSTYSEGLITGATPSAPSIQTTGLPNPIAGVTDALGFLKDPIGYLRKTFVTPFETVGIFLLGVVVVFGGILMLSGGARSVTVNAVKAGAEA